jgi:hypothetical protein
MKNRKNRCLALFVLLPAFACAQTAERLDTLLAAERVSFAQAAALILPAAGLLPPEAGEAEAFTAARPWLPRRADREGFINLGELSHLVMQSFNIPGGLMYALFPGPRYAYRALAWRRLLPAAPDPGRTLTGEELLYVAAQVLALAGEAETLEDPAPPPPEPEGAGRRGLAAERGMPPQGQGVSAGPEGILPYQEEFERE